MSLVKRNTSWKMVVILLQLVWHSLVEQPDEDSKFCQEDNMFDCWEIHKKSISMAYVPAFKGINVIHVHVGCS